MKKAIVNIVYSPQTGPTHKAYENEQGEIWRSSKKLSDKINVGMGFYSIQKPSPEDSLLVVEPFCVLERDYEKWFCKQFKYIFTWAVKAHPEVLRKKVVEINHPTYHGVPKNFDKWVPWQQRKNEIVIIANNKSSKHHSELYSLRLQMADLLKAQTNYEISWYGQIPIKRPYYKGKVPSKAEVLTKAKFSLCTENSYDPAYTYNYFTEKMPDVWVNGAVPLYMGCHNIDDFGFPKESYIDLRKFVTKKDRRHIVKHQGLIAEMNSYDEAKYNNYADIVKNDIIESNKLDKVTSFDRAYDKIINTFYRKINNL